MQEGCLKRVRVEERRGEGEIGLLGLDVGAAPAIRGLFHPSLCETAVAAGNVCGCTGV